MTAETKQDLTARLEQLLGELAPASDRRGGLEKLSAILARVQTVEEGTAAAQDDGRVTELATANSNLAEANGRIEHLQDKLTAAGSQIETLTAELVTLRTERDAATKPTT